MKMTIHISRSEVISAIRAWLQTHHKLAVDMNDKDIVGIAEEIPLACKPYNPRTYDPRD